MAEISKTTTDSNSKKGRGVKKAKRLSTRVDLTPMVDLGFLLITFFIFTTTMSQPTSLRLFLTDDSGAPTPTKASGALTLLLGKNDQVYYYEGELKNDFSPFKKTTYQGIRDLLISKKKSTAINDFVVLIKPQKESIYRNTVDVLDEMTINAVKRYALVDITAEEEDFIRVLER